LTARALSTSAGGALVRLLKPDQEVIDDLLA
jgi:hypothetical protein